MQLEPGDLQFVYNHGLLHDRTGFEDWPDVEDRRHLLRLWLSAPNDRPLPAIFRERRQLARLCDAVWKGDLKAARRIHYDLFEINQAVFYDTNPIPMKYMMKRLGIIPRNEHRLPMVPATRELAKRLDGVLKRAGALKPGKSKQAA